MKFFQAISRKGLLSTVVCMSAALTACSGGDKAATEEQAETAGSGSPKCFPSGGTVERV